MGKATRTTTSDRRPGGLPWEPRTDDVGLRIVDEVGYSLTLDEEWSVRIPRGFVWWGKDLAQHVWSEPGLEDDGFEIFRLHAQTDVLRDFEASDENLAKLDAIAALSTTSGYLVDAEARTVRLVASMYVHEETEAWVARTFKLVTATQAAVAHATATLLAEVTSATVAATPHPLSGARNDADEMLGVLEFVASVGQEPSPWEGAELEWTTAIVQGAPQTVLATGGATGLTAEFPFQSRTSLLTATTEASNPQLGNGVLLLLRLPMNIGQADGVRFAVELCRRELSSLTRAHYLGSWCWRDEEMVFVTFLPNRIHAGRGDLLNIVMSMAARAQWVAETFYGDDWQANRCGDGRALATPALLDYLAPVENDEAVGEAS